MPRNTREALLRKADQVINDLDRAFEKLLIMSQTYKPTHDKYSMFCDVTAARVDRLRAEMQDFRDKFM